MRKIEKRVLNKIKKSNHAVLKSKFHTVHEAMNHMINSREESMEASEVKQLSITLKEGIDELVEAQEWLVDLLDSEEY